MVKKILPPEIKEIEKLELPRPSEFKLDNGISVFDTRMGTEDVLKMEIVFQAGRPYEHKKLASRATAQMLKEGTKSFSSAKIAEEFDFYGASLSTPVNLDYSSIQIFSLKRHFEKLLPIIREMLTDPTFPEKEFQTLIRRSKQKLAIDLSKNDVLAYRTVTEKIFGSHHFYGFNSTPELYDTLQVTDLEEHFYRLYGVGNCQIFLAGKTDEETVRLVNQYFGQGLPLVQVERPKLPKLPSVVEKLRLPGHGELQAAIRIGCHLFTRQHPDYCGMFVLNTIFGGYFGSRLMNNIREAKGFTYNIGSTLDPMIFDGCFYVSTEVGNLFINKTIKEIYAEMDKLRETPVGAEELLMVRRYLLGSMLSMLDGPFNVSETVRTLLSEDMPLEHFDKLVTTIKTITPQDLQVLARKYLRKENMWEVVVG